MTSETYRDLLGTELPIIQAPMAGVQDSQLTLAVCGAGGLGSLPCAMLGKEQIISEIELITSTTDKPYQLNFFCHDVTPVDQKAQAEWQTILMPYFEELGISPDQNPAGASRLPFNSDIADVIEPYQPPIISFHFGLPDEGLLDRVKSWGSKVISSATTLEEALSLEQKGVDAIIAQGIEAGGHRGMFLSEDLGSQIGTFELVTKIINKVNVPIIAAGGISNANGVAKAIQLGASAVLVGTAYLLCDEAKTSQLHRAALKSDEAQQTALTNVFSGRPARGIINQIMKNLDILNPKAPAFPYASIEMTQLRLAAEALGSSAFSPLWSGQNNSGCKEISATDLTKQLASTI